MSKRGVAKVDGLGEGEMILRDPSGKVMRVVGLQNQDGSVDIYRSSGVIENEPQYYEPDLTWLDKLTGRRK